METTPVPGVGQVRPTSLRLTFLPPAVPRAVGWFTSAGGWGAQVLRDELGLRRLVAVCLQFLLPTQGSSRALSCRDPGGNPDTNSSLALRISATSGFLLMTSLVCCSPGTREEQNVTKASAWGLSLGAQSQMETSGCVELEGAGLGRGEAG